MNQNNLNRLIDHLKSVNIEQFDMSFYIKNPVKGNEFYNMNTVPAEPECGTTACIAGHIALAFRSELTQKGEIRDAAAEWLGINGYQAGNLFLGYWSFNGLSQITLDDTITHLETLRT